MNATNTNRPYTRSKSGKWMFRGLFIGLILLVGVIYGLQHLLWLHHLQWDYKNAIFPSFFRTPDAYHYITQLKEIYEGNVLLSNSYLTEYKNTVKSVWPRFPFYLISIVGKGLHLEVHSVVILMDFLLPPLTFFLAFVLLYALSEHRRLSLSGALVLVLTPQLLWIKHFIPTLLRFVMIGPPLLMDMHCYHCFSRPFNPQLSYPFLLAAFFFFVRYLKTSRYKDIVCCLIFGGMVSYSYVYFSTYLYTFLGVSMLVFFFLKASQYARKSLVIFGSTVLIALPFWYSVFTFSTTALRQVSWMYKSHLPIFDFQLILTVPLCLYIIWGLLKKTLNVLSGVFALALVLSGFICLNQHVITGINTQPEWHYNMFVRPQALIFAAALLFKELTDSLKIFIRRIMQWLRKYSVKSLFLGGGIGLLVISRLFSPSFVASYCSPDGSLSSQFALYLRFLSFGGVIFGISVILFGILLNSQTSYRIKEIVSRCIRSLKRGGEALFCSQTAKMLLYFIVGGYFVIDVTAAQYIYYRDYIVPRYGDLQQLAPALKWLNTHTEKETVILGSVDYASTGVITIYTHNNVYISIHAQFYAIPSLEEFRERLYNLFYFMGITSEDDFRSEISQHIFLEGTGISYSEYQQTLQQNVYARLKKYQVDYVLYGPREQQSFKLNPEKTYSFLEKEYDDGIVKIFRIVD